MIYKDLPPKQVSDCGIKKREKNFIQIILSYERMFLMKYKDNEE